MTFLVCFDGEEGSFWSGFWQFLLVCLVGEEGSLGAVLVADFGVAFWWLLGLV